MTPGSKQDTALKYLVTTAFKYSSVMEATERMYDLGQNFADLDSDIQQEYETLEEELYDIELFQFQGNQRILDRQYIENDLMDSSWEELVEKGEQLEQLSERALGLNYDVYEDVKTNFEQGTANKSQETDSKNSKDCGNISVSSSAQVNNQNEMTPNQNIEHSDAQIVFAPTIKNNTTVNVS